MSIRSRPEIMPLDTDSPRGQERAARKRDAEWQASAAPRRQRTPDEIFIAGFESGRNLAPLTEAQLNLVAAAFSTILTAQPDGGERAA
jgi:hypothetical protein